MRDQHQPGSGALNHQHQPGHSLDTLNYTSSGAAGWTPHTPDAPACCLAGHTLDTPQRSSSPAPSKRTTAAWKTQPRRRVGSRRAAAVRVAATSTGPVRTVMRTKMELVAALAKTEVAMTAPISAVAWAVAAINRSSGSHTRLH